MTTLLQRAYDWEKNAPNQLYMTQPVGGGQVKTFTWKETLDEARRMAAYLQSLGLPPKSNIAILSKNCAHFILSDLAIWMAGHVSVALYPTLNAETVRYILEHSESKLLFLGKLDTWDDMKAGVPTDLPVVAYPLAPPSDAPQWDDLIRKHEPLAGTPGRDPEELAIIVYTSGSTGQPKGVMHSFGSMYRAAVGVKDIMEFGPEDRMLSYLPLAHVFERSVVEAGSLAHGFQIFFAESLDTFVEDIKRARPTLFVSVPRLWLKFQLGVFQKMPQKKLSRLLKVPILSGIIKKKLLTGLGLDHVRLAISGSAPIPPDLIQWYRDIGLELLEGYAMSEDFAYSHASLPGKSRVGYVGHPLPGVDVKISEEGEVLIKSPGNMMGYYKEPETMATCYTPDGYFRTGDRGERDADGRLRITGRVKELFKTSKGKYVAPAPIENLINASPYVETSCVSGSGQPQPHALAVLAEQYRTSTRDESVQQEITRALEMLRKEINQSVDPHEQLDFITVVKDDWQIENGFLTPTMKIKRNVIEDTYGPRAESWYRAKKPVIWE
jgi:long-chain acyl-CoA synthetase